MDIDKATPEELKAEVKRLTEVNAGMTQKIEDERKGLQDEAAKRRVERNEALKQAEALRQVVEAHGVKHGDLDLSKLSVDDGKATGETGYKPKVDVTPGPNKTEVTKATTGLTPEDLKTMSAEQINTRWDEVKTVLEGTSATT